MDVEYELLQALLNNRDYSPVDMAVLVATLDGVEQAGTRSRAVFQRAPRRSTRGRWAF